MILERVEVFILV
jgi:hypothetical protein